MDFRKVTAIIQSGVLEKVEKERQKLNESEIWHEV